MEFRDLKLQYKRNKHKINRNINRVLKSTNFIGGQEIMELEKNFSNYVGVKHCISCANGTDALMLVLKAWGIGKGDAVFVPDFTFFATAEAVSILGATPVFVDVNRDTYNMESSHLRIKIEEILATGKLSPKVIIPVDLFGLLADYEKLNHIAKDFDLKILEDAAQSFGAEFQNQKSCSFGNAAITSFFPAKPLGCYGDGGAIFTNDDNLADLLRSLRFHGKGKDKYDNVRIGYNSRLDTIQAAILNVKFDSFIKFELNKVNQVANYYNQFLKGYVEIPNIPTNYRSSYAQYTIKLTSSKQRNDLKKYLESKKIPTMIYYVKPLHCQTAYKIFKISDLEYPNSILLSETVLSLPIHPYMSRKQIQKICSLIINFINDQRLSLS